MLVFQQFRIVHVSYEELKYKKKINQTDFVIN